MTIAGNLTVNTVGSPPNDTGYTVVNTGTVTGTFATYSFGAQPPTGAVAARSATVTVAW